MPQQSLPTQEMLTKKRRCDVRTVPVNKLVSAPKKLKMK